MSSSPKARVGLPGWRRFLALLLALLLFAALAATGLLAVAHIVLSHENLERWVRQVPWDEVIEEFSSARAPTARSPLLLAAGRSLPSGSDYGLLDRNGDGELTEADLPQDEDELRDFLDDFGVLDFLEEGISPDTLSNLDLYGVLEDNLRGTDLWRNLPRGDIEDFLDEFVRDFAVVVADKAAQLLLGDEGDEVTLTSDDIVDFLMDKERDIARFLEDLGYQGEYHPDYDALRDALPQVMGEGVALADALPPQGREALSLLRELLSGRTLVLAGCVTLALAALMVFVCAGHGSSLLAFLAAPANLAGVVYLLLALAARLAEAGGLFSPALFDLADLVLTPLLWVGLAVTVASALLLVIYRVIRTREKKKLSAVAW